MKKLSFLLLIAFFVSSATSAQEKQEKRESPMMKISQKINSGATIDLQYGQPSLKGREIGKSVEPMDGQVWRTGANEATVFQVDQNVKIDGKDLPAGKYGFFTLFNGNKVTLIFNKVWDQWGAFNYDASKDELRVDTNVEKESNVAEKLTYQIRQNGEVDILWGDRKVSFTVK